MQHTIHCGLAAAASGKQVGLSASGWRKRSRTGRTKYGNGMEIEVGKRYLNPPPWIHSDLPRTVWGEVEV